MSQQVEGLWVYDTYVKAAVNSRGELVSLIENLAPAPPRLGSAAIDEAAALNAAFAHLGLNAGDQFVNAPSVTRVAVPMSDRSMRTGFVVTTWTREGNRLYETLVDGNGRVLSSVLRTNSDRYNIFPEYPNAGPAPWGQAEFNGPGGTDWLFAGDQSTVEIAGNNVHAYLDTENDSVPDGTGTTVTNGEFLTDADLDVPPGTPANQEVSVQNLFFHNNLIHGILYDAGFDEAAGNFQEDNFGTNPRGDGDSVNAEAQDGGGTDNANFATPRDGQSPRMQMYLWSAPTTLVVNEGGGGPYDVGTAEFGDPLDPTGVKGDLKLADDGNTGPIRGGGPPQPGSITDGCEAFPTNFFDGMIALIDRGGCSFVQKVSNAQDAGALAVVIANNDADNPGDEIYMAGDDDTITIPSVGVSFNAGAELKAALDGTVTVTMSTSGQMRDAALDTDIVYHEYGHGLTWRMIGRMDDAMAGAIGEGMSDVLAIIINDDPVVGEYSTGDSGGIRRESYEGYSLDYGDFSAAEVHDDGEIYGAIGWKMWKLFQDKEGLSSDVVLAYLVDGMNYTPASPTFEDMRDGILAAIANSTANSAHKCIVWEAFAEFGVGVGASGTVRGSNPVIAESFVSPCNP